MKKLGIILIGLKKGDINYITFLFFILKIIYIFVEIKYMKTSIYKYLSKDIIDNEIIPRWNESHRFYHNIYHLNYLLDRIYSIVDITELERDILIISAYFHDIVYNPKKSNNEQKSVDILNDYTQIPTNIREKCSEIIMDTSSSKTPTDELSKLFWLLDREILNSDIGDLIEYEHKIFKEYQFVPYDTYKKKRIEFLQTLIKRTNHIEQLISYIEKRKINIGIYAGSFNPYHIGHHDVLKKSEKIFDKVIVAFGNNPDKDKRNIIIPNCLEFHQVDEYNGLITDYIDHVENINVNATLIRGIRNGIDLDYESNQLSFINDIRPDTKVIYIPCDKKYEHISSSAIRNLMKFDKELTKKYLP